MLQDLDRLTPGDVLILNVLDRTMVYRIGEGLEEKDAILMLTPGGVKDLDLSLSAVQAPEPEPEPTQTPEPRYTPKPTATPDPEATAETEAAQETETAAEETPEPTPTPTPTPTPEPAPETEQTQTLRSATEQLTLLTGPGTAERNGPGHLPGNLEERAAAGQSGTAGGIPGDVYYRTDQETVLYASRRRQADCQTEEKE